MLLGAEGRDAIFDVFGHLGADLEAEDQVVGQQRGERDEETAEAAAYVCDRDGFGHCGVFSQRVVLFFFFFFFFGGDDWSSCSSSSCSGGSRIIIWCMGDESRVVRGPVHEGWACGARRGIMVLVSSRQPI